MTQLFRSPEELDPIGQYASDYERFAGDPRLDQDPLMVKAMRGTGDRDFHQKGLFDQTDRQHRTIEDDVLALEGMRVVTDLRNGRSEKLDAADQWLRDNDPDFSA